ncbi:protease modulator HflK [Erythrobacter sp. THAF29]|uniref:protease modulator HflK n=1 Tax=Erythrobacter sp. THAF29 TaxID=2587851 RepID=UPI0012A9E437|nr:protease modulator HflK [Erythrobacter sp. THAF29]QFT76745.1 Modulator of FtsH protease HflK [Erythrobacter sp. THAF29]
MQIFDRLRERFAMAGQGLAMAGKKNPWGSSGNKGGGSGGGDGATPPSGDGDKPEGPRNPWLPGGSSGDGQKRGGRRSASIEDIFKNRGPEGPRRGGGGGSGFRLPERPGGKSWVPIVIVSIGILFLILSSMHLVEPREKAVVKTLGNYSRTLDSGLHFTLPFPLETVDIEDVEGVRAVNIPGSGERAKLILTGDQNLVDLSYIVRWRIADLPDFKFQLAEPIETVNEVAEAAMRASVAEKTLDETFTGAGRAEIQQRVRERMQETLDAYRAGITVVGVEIEKADPPGDVVDAFRDVSVAEQDADRARNQARGYAQQTIAGAEGEAEAFDKVYEQYRLAPEVTRQRLYYETMERVLAQTDKTIVEADGVTPYLPLPELRRRANQSAEITARPQQNTQGQ